MHTTYTDLLISLREHDTDVIQRFVKQSSVLERSAGEVFESASQRGSQLVNLGLSRQARVALLVSEPSDFLPLLYGCLLQGLVAVPFYPPPLFGQLGNYHAALGAMLEVADVQVAIIDDGSLKRLGPAFTRRNAVELSALPSPAPFDLPTVQPSDLALLQFTSGSTQAPRGVRITHNALLANAKAIMLDGLAATSEDHGVCWLPLYHDMGLVGFGLAPLLTATPVTFIPTSRFIRNPNVWLQTLHDVRGSITFAPNFAYALATKRGTARDLDLSCVRMWGCGAEPISERTLQAFEAHFATSGVSPGSVAPCYGLAEATLAVTFTPPRSIRHTERLSREALAESMALVTSLQDDDTTSAVTVVSCGKPLPGYELTVVDAEGGSLKEGHLGEVVVAGPSLGEGYEGQPSATRDTFTPSGLHTGDRGYLRDGELFLVNRIKETIVLNGRKYDPHGFEHAIEELPSVRRAVAVNALGTEGEALAVAVERTLEPGQTDDTLRYAIRAALAARFGAQTSFVICTSPGTLPRTTSGKLQRTLVRSLIENGKLA